MADDFDFTEINLDDERRRRAAEREAQGRVGKGVPLRVGGEVVATMPFEFPLKALSPLRDLDQEITLVLRAVMQAWRAGNQQGVNLDAASLIVDLLASNPALPKTLLDVVGRVVVGVVGQDGYDGLMGADLSREDYGFLLGKVAGFYGLTLGESSPPSDTATGGTGEQSKPTSLATTQGSTPDASGETPALPTTTSESDAS